MSRGEQRARNSLRGHRANNAGNAFEAWLDIHHQRALAWGILAHIDKIDPPAVVHKGVVEFGERTVSDYVGLLGGGGARYLAVEAKSIEDKEYLPKSKVLPLQQAHLDVTARAGGLALLVVEFRCPVPVMVHGLELDTSWRRYACPWQSVPWQVLRTAKSVAEVDLLRDGWKIVTDCYLERFHPRGEVLVKAAQGRRYARE